MTETIKDNSQQHTGNWVEDIRKGAEITLCYLILPLLMVLLTFLSMNLQLKLSAYHAHNKNHQNRHVLTIPCVEKC